MPLQRSFKRNCCMVVIINFTTDAVTTISYSFKQLRFSTAVFTVITSDHILAATILTNIQFIQGLLQLYF